MKPFKYFVYICIVLVIYAHGILYMAYYSYHGLSKFNFCASSSYTFLDLTILSTAVRVSTGGE